MRASKIIATLFILLGLVLVGFGLGAHPVPKWLIWTGLSVSVFGALMFPSAGAGPAFQQITIALGSLPIFGGRRVGDVPLPVPPVIQPTEDKKT